MSLPVRRVSVRNRRSIINVTGRGVGGVVMDSIQIYNNAAGGSCLQWNGDKSSVVVDTEFQDSQDTGTPLINLQSGGGFFENSWWTNSLPTCVNITTTDPLYLYSMQPEHSTLSAVDINQAQNVVMLMTEFETPSSSGIGPQMAITGSKDIWVEGVILGQPGSQR
jgi:hypothetical protein